MADDLADGVVPQDPDLQRPVLVAAVVPSVGGARPKRRVAVVAIAGLDDTVAVEVAHKLAAHVDGLAARRQRALLRLVQRARELSVAVGSLRGSLRGCENECGGSVEGTFSYAHPSGKSRAVAAIHGFDPTCHHVGLLF
jgi:hypothetical protein